jgi:hypothetical protein
MAVVRAIALVVLAACTGDIPSSGDAATGSGSAKDAAVDAPKLMWVDASNGSGVPCKTAVSPVPTLGHHNTGKNCFDNCHNHGFTLAGTLYTTSISNTGAGGATITVVDSNNKTVDIVVNSDGNFYTSTALAYPVLTFASSCPTAVKMNVAVAQSGRGCNTCHGVNTAQMYLQQ